LTKKRSTSFSHNLSEIEYIVAHNGLFRNAPIPEAYEALDEPPLFRAVLDRGLLDYIKGPDVIEEFHEVSAWLYNKDGSGDFKTVCDLAILEESKVRHVFQQCRYEELSECLHLTTSMTKEPHDGSHKASTTTGANEESLGFAPM